MALTALDLGLRGATVGLVLMVSALLFRDWPFRTLTTLRVALGAAAVAYAISTAPFFPLRSFGWNAPLVMLFTGSPVIFWLWARAVFDDGFALRPQHLAIWALVAGLGVFAYCGWTISPRGSVTGGRLFALASIGLALLALVQTLPVWRADLVAGRRRLLIVFLLATAAFVVVNAASGLAAIPWRSVSFSYALGIGVLAMLGVWTSFPQFMGQPALAGAEATVRRREVASRAGLLAAHKGSLQRLEYLMTVERAYRQEGLTIGFLAVKLGLPEHRLRTLINEGLGHRNFNAFLNRYRLDEAKAALVDPDQLDVPVLTIALDAGFQSITPFNRAFKADTGLTPTEFRQMSLAGSGTGIAPTQPTVRSGDF
ncbi:AraC family transcriptional regulator [Bradyrhizobium sp. Arg237L]|uniref:AraC family transcriptional regulator n=1 Tax=Bradyrhizobium sp. Arg237L TaxID=3003352 RepID=UPI00249DF81F|nr:AraC family transcriptional regulator [Bradyrhizobium sp. Arg237L]MDI4233154.1 AraC family transcriptional regulator [Bradyrhizobium sp. Arg237L]